jgi:hypothetical protein
LDEVEDVITQQEEERRQEFASLTNNDIRDVDGSHHNQQKNPQRRLVESARATCILYTDIVLLSDLLSALPHSQP